MAKERTRRTPINGTRNKLKLRGGEPGYKYRIVNDDGDRVRMLEDMGYEIVNDEKIRVGDRKVATATGEGSPSRVHVGRDANGNPQYGYVMRIKEEWFKEDQAAKQKEIDELEASMKADAREKYSDYGKLILEKG